MDKYLVDPLAKWIVHSTGWSVAAATRWARTVVVVVLVGVALLFMLTMTGGEFF